VYDESGSSDEGRSLCPSSAVPISREPIAELKHGGVNLGKWKFVYHIFKKDKKLLWHVSSSSRLDLFVIFVRQPLRSREDR
jgi:hypothetical protein